MVPSLAGMDPVDYARYVAIACSFLAASFSTQKTWLRADVTFCFGMGIVWLLFPRVFLDFQVTGPPSKVHDLMGRSMGALFLFYLVPIVLNRRTKDDKVFTSIFISRFMGFAIMLFALFYCHWKFPRSLVRLTSRQFWFMGLALAGWMFGNVRHLLVSGGATNYSLRHPEGRLKYHLFVDVFFILPGALYMLGYAGDVLVDLAVKVRPDDAILFFLGTCHAAISFSECLYTMSAHTFDDPDAVKNVFKLRLLMVAVYLPFNQLTGLLSSHVLIVSVILHVMIGLNSISALHHLNKKI